MEGRERFGAWPHSAGLSEVYLLEHRVRLFRNARRWGALCLLQQGDRQAYLALPDESFGQVKLGQSEVGIDIQGGFELCTRGSDLTLLDQQLAEEVMRSCGLWIGRYSSSGFRLCFREVVQLQECDGIVAVSVGVGRVELYGFLQMERRLLPVS